MLKNDENTVELLWHYTSTILVDNAIQRVESACNKSKEVYDDMSKKSTMNYQLDLQGKGIIRSIIAEVYDELPWISRSIYKDSKNHVTYSARKKWKCSIH